MKRVYQFNEQGELQNSYKSVADAARAVGVSKETISMVLIGKESDTSRPMRKQKISTESCTKKDKRE